MSMTNTPRPPLPGSPPRSTAKLTIDSPENRPICGPLPATQRAANLVAILVPMVGIAAAMTWTWGYGFNWIHLALFLGMYMICGFGITIGYHRYFTHRSFETGPVIKILLGLTGSMAIEGSILNWVAVHRCHHQHSDAEEDPHSPHTHGAGLFNMIRGLWWAHMGWMLRSKERDLTRYVSDLRGDRSIRVMSALFPAWVGLGLLIPTLLGGLITMSWSGALLGLIWGGFVRTFFLHHMTWSINSVCHIWGTRPFRSHDESRNNLICGIFALGEGWHNAHHAFPRSARHGLRWWEIDLSYMLIRLLQRLGLVWNVHVPNATQIRAKSAGLPS